MATADGSILIRTQFDKKDLNTGLASITKSLQKISSLVKIVLGVGLISLGKQSLQLASDLQEVQNVVDVAFGEMSATIDEFAKDSITSLGISELTAKKTASAFGAMANGLGFAREETANMSIELTKLSADMASFFNMTQDETRTALASVFTGETETLKRYGILITEVNLQEYARQQGIQKSITAMTQQEKVMLRYNYIMSVTGQAQGDFARTQDSWANQMRILTENWKQFLTVVGNGSINILAPFVKTLNMAVQSATNLATAISQVLGLQSTTEVVTGGTSANISDAVSNQEDLADATNATNKAAKRQLAFFDDINVLSKENAGTSATGISSGVSGGLSSISTEVDAKGMSELSKKIEPLVKAISSLFDAVKNFTKNAVSGFVDFFKEKFDFVNIQNLTSIISLLADSLNAITPEQAERFGRSIAEIVFAIGILKAAAKGFAIITSIGAALKTIAGYLPLAINFINALNPANLPAVSDYLYSISDAYASFIDFINEFFASNQITSAINQFLFDLAEFIKDVFLTVFNIKEIFGFQWTKDLFATANEAFAKVKEAFGNKDWAGVGIGILEAIGNGIAGAITFIFEPIIKFIDGIVNTIINSINFIITQLNKLPGVAIDLLGTSGISKTPEWSSLKIPEVATGTVLPATQAFTGVGSQGGYGPIYNQQQATNDKNVQLVLDGKELARATLPYVINEFTRQGYNLRPIGGTK